MTNSSNYGYLWTIFNEIKDFTLAILIITDLLFTAVILLYESTAYDLKFFVIFDIILCIILFLDFLTIYRRNPDILKKHKLTFAINILAIIPFNYIILYFFGAYKLLKILQLLSIFKVFKLFGLRDSFKYFVKHRLLRILFILLIVYIVFSAYLLYKVDPGVTSIFNGIWYNVVTVTSVGYGDIAPVSYSGRLIGMFTIVLGVLFVSVFTAAMSGMYMEIPNEESRDLMKNMDMTSKTSFKNLNEKVDKLEDEVATLNDKIDKLTELLENKKEK